nr:hypothetical protein [Sicyoidochytrium minutum DNA virus]
MEGLNTVEGLLDGSYRPRRNAWLTSLTKKRLATLFFALGILGSGLWNLAPTKASQGVGMSFVVFGGVYLLVMTMGHQYWTTWCWTIVFAYFITCFVSVWGFAFPASGSEYLPYSAPAFLPIFSGVGIFVWFVAYVISNQVGVSQKFDETGKDLVQRLRDLQQVLQDRNTTRQQKREAANELRKVLEIAKKNVGQTAAAFSYSESAADRVKDQAAVFAQRIRELEEKQLAAIETKARTAEQIKRRYAALGKPLTDEEAEGIAREELEAQKEETREGFRRFLEVESRTGLKPDFLTVTGSRLGGYLRPESEKNVDGATVVARLYTEFLFERLLKLRSLTDFVPEGRAAGLESEDELPTSDTDGTPLSLSVARRVARKVLGDPTALAVTAIRRSERSGRPYQDELRDLVNFLFSNAVQEGYLAESVSVRFKDLFDTTEREILVSALERLGVQQGVEYSTEGKSVEELRRTLSTADENALERAGIDKFLAERVGVLGAVAESTARATQNLGEISPRDLYAFFTSFSRGRVDLELGEGSAAAATFDVLERGTEKEDESARKYFRGLTEYAESAGSTEAGAESLREAAVYSAVSPFPTDERELSRARDASRNPAGFGLAVEGARSGLGTGVSGEEFGDTRVVVSRGRNGIAFSRAVEKVYSGIGISRPASEATFEFLQYLTRVESTSSPREDYFSLLDRYKKTVEPVVMREMEEEADEIMRREDEEAEGRITAMPPGRKAIRALFNGIFGRGFRKKSREQRRRDILKKLNTGRLRRARVNKLRAETIRRDLGFLRELFVKTDGMTEEEFIETYGKDHLRIFRVINDPKRRPGIRRILFNRKLLDSEASTDIGETESLYEEIRKIFLRGALTEEKRERRESRRRSKTEEQEEEEEEEDEEMSTGSQEQEP